MRFTQTKDAYPLHRITTSPLRLTLCLAAGLAVLPAVTTARPISLQIHAPQAAVSASTAQTEDQKVALIAGLILVERDLLLGQLFLRDGMVSGDGSHFLRPRRDSFPQIKDGLAKAGLPDLEPLLIALEQAKGQAAVYTAYVDVLAGLEEAKSALKPSGHDVLRAVIQSVEAGGSLLDPCGKTNVIAYQEAWGLLMVARRELDILTHSSDPAIKKSATKMAVAFDDVILSAPDPDARAPVPFDPALVDGLVGTLKSEAGKI
ncbi:hypothetical protein [Tabrizicola sp.]|uniref:hypothetical protein n=1 Tax=Tabrizicola sp. TaxID=2005166 RepID=UPI003F39CC5D